MFAHQKLLDIIARFRAVVAQLVEQLIRNQ